LEAKLTGVSEDRAVRSICSLNRMPGLAVVTIDASVALQYNQRMLGKVPGNRLQSLALLWALWVGTIMLWGRRECAQRDASWGAWC
jgi:hypothetical protein